MKINNVSGVNAVSGVSKPRSVFPRPVDLKTCGKASYVIPVFWDEVLPGDSLKTSIHGVARFIPNIHPTMDNAYMDLYGFFIPNRLLWKSWEKFITLGNDPQSWTEDTGLNVPQIKFKGTHSSGPIQNSLADYLGIPLAADAAGEGGEGEAPSLEVSALPFRAYNKIINDWFVNLNVSSPIFEDDSDEDRDYNNSEFGLYTAFKLPDVFTLALPSAQRGPAVSIGLSGDANVNAVGDSFLNIGVFDDNDEFFKTQLLFQQNDNSLLTEKFVGSEITATIDHKQLPISGGMVHIENNFNHFRPYDRDFLAKIPEGKTNLVADLSTANATTINQLRLAFQIQAFFELNARCGNNRYIEYLKSVFGVSNGDARLQRAEYLFGCRNMINCNEITQTSSSTETSPIGEVGGKICNVVEESNVMNKSFNEHGIVMFVMVVRNANTYSQGVPKKFDKKTWLDFFNPVFDCIGEQPIAKKTLFLSNSDTDNEVFGFQEAWYNYRYGESIATSYFRADAAGSLLSWTYGDLYENAPSLDEAFLKSDYTNIERTLALQGQAQQFIVNFLFDNVWTRTMRTHSVPGRIDHI